MNKYDQKNFNDPSSDGLRSKKLLSNPFIRFFFWMGVFVVFSIILGYVLMLILYASIPPIVDLMVVLISIPFGFFGYNFVLSGKNSLFQIFRDLTFLSSITMVILLSLLTINHGFEIFTLSLLTPLWYLLAIPFVIIILVAVLFMYVLLIDKFFIDFLVYLLQTPPENEANSPRFWLRDYLLMKGIRIHKIILTMSDMSPSEEKERTPRKGTFSTYLRRPLVPEAGGLYASFYKLLRDIETRFQTFRGTVFGHSLLTILVISFCADFITSLYVFINPIANIKIPLCILFSFFICLILIPIDAALQFKIKITYSGGGQQEHLLSDVLMTRVILLFVPPILPLLYILFYALMHFFMNVSLPATCISLSFGYLAFLCKLLFVQIPLMVGNLFLALCHTCFYFLTIFISSFMICLLINIVFFYCYTVYIQSDLYVSLRYQIEHSKFLQKVDEQGV